MGVTDSKDNGIHAAGEHGDGYTVDSKSLVSCSNYQRKQKGKYKKYEDAESYQQDAGHGLFLGYIGAGHHAYVGITDVDL